jgi:hypothetical protein
MSWTKRHHPIGGAGARSRRSPTRGQALLHRRRPLCRLGDHVHPPVLSSWLSWYIYDRTNMGCPLLLRADLEATTSAPAIAAVRPSPSSSSRRRARPRIGRSHARWCSQCLLRLVTWSRQRLRVLDVETLLVEETCVRARLVSPARCALTRHMLDYCSISTSCSRFLRFFARSVSDWVVSLQNRGLFWPCATRDKQLVEILQY